MPSFYIRGIQGRQWGSATLDGLAGGAGLGFYQLWVSVRLNVDAASPSNDPALANTPHVLTDLRADVRLGNSILGVATPSAQQLPVMPADFTQERSLQLRIELDRARLEAIEAVRAGKDMQLAITFYAQITDTNGSAHWETQSTGHLVTQSDWAQILNDFGYRRTLLLEVPVVTSRHSPELAAAVADVERAQKAMERGDYRDAVAHCRGVMENLSRALKDESSAPPQNQRDMTKADRLRQVRRAFRNFTNPAHHQDDVSVNIEWSRLDAVFAITVAASLLNELAAPGAR